jgi:hypothetical protein
MLGLNKLERLPLTSLFSQVQHLTLGHVPILRVEQCKVLRLFSFFPEAKLKSLVGNKHADIF